MTGIDNSLVRTGGIAFFAALLIHMVANLAIKQFPPADPTLPQLAEYLAAEQRNWQIVHALRYPAILGLSLFYAGLFALSRGGGESPAHGWEFVGLIGACLHLANLLVANGLERLAFTSVEMLSRNPDLFWLTFRQSRILFETEIVTWGIAILGFAMSGWRSLSLPRWLVLAGLGAAASALAAGFVVPMLEPESELWWTVDLATLIALVWFAAVAANMALGRVPTVATAA